MTQSQKQQTIRALLPDVVQQTIQPGTPLEAILTTMAAFLEPLEEILITLDAVYDVERAPEEFVPFLARCVTLEWLEESGIETTNLRRLIANIHELAMLRGTTTGLCRFLEIATGIDGFHIQETVKKTQKNTKPTTPQMRSFHITVLYPPEAAVQSNLIRLIVEHEKPAYLTFELKEFSDEGGK
jgi:phage tail-like protein